MFETAIPFLGEPVKVAPDRDGGYGEERRKLVDGDGPSFVDDAEDLLPALRGQEVADGPAHSRFSFFKSTHKAVNVKEIFHLCEK
jgi:hypothetical protein